MPATRLPPLLCRRTMAAPRELVFVKNCSPSLASKLPSTTTSAGLPEPVDSTEMLAAYAEPADNAAQANARDRTSSCLCSAPARSLVRTEHQRDGNVLALQRSEAIVWHLRARVGWWVLPHPRPSLPPPRPELSITPPHRSHQGPVPDPLLLPPGHGHVRRVAARGARETTLPGGQGAA